MKAAFKMNVTIKSAKLFLQGEEEAIALVYKSYRALLYFIISTYISQKEDCDDVYQNVFMKILSKSCLQTYFAGVTLRHKPAATV